MCSTSYRKGNVAREQQFLAQNSVNLQVKGDVTLDGSQRKFLEQQNSGKFLSVTVSLETNNMLHGTLLSTTKEAKRVLKRRCAED